MPRRSPATRLAAILAVATQFLVVQCFADGGPSDENGSTERYHRQLTRSARETFDVIHRYCRDQSDAPDHRTAVQDLCGLARTWGWETEARDVVEPVLSREGLEPAIAREILSVVALGAARAGDRAASAAAYERFLRALRLRNPNEATDLAQSLSLVWQLRGDRDAAAAVYEQLSTAFFLNAEVRDFAAARSKRLTLVGQPLPSLSVSDLADREVTSSDFAGKVILLDFWATNCRPCLEELPRLRQIHRDCSPHGLEIVGLSFDEDRATLEHFLMQESLPWRLALGRKMAEESFHVSLIPCLMLVDRQGRIAATDVRPFDLRRTIESLLDRRP